MQKSAGNVPNLKSLSHRSHFNRNQSINLSLFVPLLFGLSNSVLFFGETTADESVVSERFSQQDESTNVTKLLLSKFQYLFEDLDRSLLQQELESPTATTAHGQSIADQQAISIKKVNQHQHQRNNNNNNNNNHHHHHLNNKHQLQNNQQLTSGGPQAECEGGGWNGTLERDVAAAEEPPVSSPSMLETRRIESRENPLLERDFFRVFDRVFSRVHLPELYKGSSSRLRNGGGGGPTATSGGNSCSVHIGCIDELSNFPSLLPRKSNISSIFTIYTRETAKSHGRRVVYEPTMHHQLRDANQMMSERDVEGNLLERHRRVSGNSNQNNKLLQRSHSTTTRAEQNPLSAHNHNNTNNNINRLRLKAQFKSQQQATANSERSRATAQSWRTASDVVHSQEFPFDLAALERSGFDSALNTRVIIGGYFAKEEEEWIEEVVRQWLTLEPSNVIKVSWADGNRGLYHTAAYNSRIVARQLTLFLHYLDQMFHVDLDRLHLVGHSLGAHIAGSVGSDNEGRIARITGLDPAGPIFVELNASMRLDPSDAKFVDVVHTNGGYITKGALGLSLPSGHVDYYSNGGSLQPGCYFSSVSKSIMDPVERVACSHRRSYRYFIEIIKLTISATADATQTDESATSTSSPTTTSAHGGDSEMLEDSGDSESTQPPQRSRNTERVPNLPRAFLFEAKHEDLVRLVQPEILFVSLSATSVKSSTMTDLAPLRRQLEFHSFSPDFPPGKRGMYFFRTRSESPFFSSKQYALTLRTESVVKRKMLLTAKIEQTVVAEVEVDEIPGIYVVAFVPNDPKLLAETFGDSRRRVPRLSIMWRHRTFNLLLGAAQTELHLSGLELSLLDAIGGEEADGQARDPGEGQLVIEYANLSPTTVGASNSSFAATKKTSEGLDLTRNQWHKLEGRLVRSKF